MGNTIQQREFFDAIRQADYAAVKSAIVQDAELLNAFDDKCFGATPLNLATHFDDQRMINLLLDHGADINRKSDWWAGPWSTIQSALQGNRLDLAGHLAKRGAEIDAHAAAGLGRLEQLRQLLDARPELVRERGGDGCFPLHFAYTAECAELLLERDAELDARDVDHYSTAAQYLAKHHPAVSRFLLGRGAAADIFTAIVADDVDRAREMIGSDHGLLEWRMNQTYYPPGPEHDVLNILTFMVGHDADLLQAAASANRPGMIDVLVDLGADVNQRSGYDERVDPSNYARIRELLACKKS